MLFKTIWCPLMSIICVFSWISIMLREDVQKKTPELSLLVCLLFFFFLHYDRTAGNRKYLTGSLRVTRRDCSIRFLENIMVSTDVTYSIFRGYTEIELVSPKGTRSPLLTRRSNDNDYSPGTFVWKFRTVHFWGENTIGNWKLRTRSLSNYGQGLNFYLCYSFYWHSINTQTNTISV